FVFQEDSMEELVEAIVYASQKKGVCKLLVAGTSMDKESVQWKEELRQKLEGRFAQVAIAAVDKTNGDFAKMLQEYNGVISVERIGKSTYTNIEKEIRLCDFYETPLMGFVVIK
ncbi:MAG: hypothetical protein J6R94_05070, partial [Agathobacter sp.]|nr:hypothetical protein [Agathobacter sp.]